ncbi:MAG: hypothetical protein RL538_319 [Candidatus Parcubacteria bacterium]|jgi:hypothetical protein
MKYLLDFDHTLMDTEALKAEAFRSGTTCFVGTVEFWQHHSVMPFLFTDVLPWLKTKEKSCLHILTAFKPSQGPDAQEFQKAKIASDGFSELVESVTVMEGMKGKVAVEIAKQFPPHEPIAFVDDRLDQCLSVKQALPHAHCFLMLRYNVCPPDVAPDINVVTSLAEVDAIMNEQL